MRIATLQFAPKLGCVEENVARADSLLASSTAPLENLDLLVLPELTFTGYNHPSLSSILPLLEPTSSGPSTQWALCTARRLNCLITVGYPELFSPSPPPVHTLKPTMMNLGSDDVADYYKVTAYNSTVTVDGEGKVVAHYRKRFLWYADEVWAQEGGEGFETAELEFPVRDSNPPSTHHHLPSAIIAADHGSTNGEEELDSQSSSTLPLPPSKTTRHTTTFAICMDLNTHHFTPPPSPPSPLELTHPLAAHILSSGTTLLVLSTAWLTNLPAPALCSDPQEPDWDTVKFWVERLSPLLYPQEKESRGEKGGREII
ncbi:MAG: hypothetical protein Q9228_002747, partial [Teloschistes exilis]